MKWAMKRRTLLLVAGALLLGASATATYDPKDPSAREPKASASERRRVAPEVRIAPGKRAFAIRLNHLTQDIIQPNARVHVLEVMDDPARHTPIGRLIVPNVRVLAVDSVTEVLPDGSSIKAAVAAIEVSPEYAEFLARTAARRQLALVLGEPGDSALAEGFITVSKPISEVVRPPSQENASPAKRRR